MFGTHFPLVLDLINPSSNRFISFTLSLLDKVTTGTCDFVFVILNSVTLSIAYITQPLQFYN